VRPSDDLLQLCDPVSRQRADVTGSPTGTAARPILVGDPILSKDRRAFTQAFNTAGQQTNAAFGQYTATSESAAIAVGAADHVLS